VVRLEDVQRLRDGVVISTPVQRDRVRRIITARTLPCRADKVGPRTLEIVLQEGRNRQIRRMLDHVGYEAGCRLVKLGCRDLDVWSAGVKP